MANTKEIKDRIKSVRDTQKITNAMYLIASTKMRKAKSELDHTRPYFEAIKGEIKRIFRTSKKEAESRWFYPEDGAHTLMTKEEILNKIATLTGGRAAEELIFHSITTGASNDIEQATKLARALVTRYGMTEDFDMVALETVNNAYLGGDASLACSEQTAAQVDAKVVEIVQAEHKKAYQLLADNKRKLDEIAQYLYEKETISGEEFMRILNAQPQLPAGPSADSTNQAQ